MWLLATSRSTLASYHKDHDPYSAGCDKNRRCEKGENAPAWLSSAPLDSCVFRERVTPVEMKAEVAALAPLAEDPNANPDMARFDALANKNKVLTIAQLKLLQAALKLGGRTLSLSSALADALSQQPRDDTGFACALTGVSSPGARGICAKDKCVPDTGAQPPPATTSQGEEIDAEAPATSAPGSPSDDEDAPSGSGEKPRAKANAATHTYTRSALFLLPFALC